MQETSKSLSDAEVIRQVVDGNVNAFEVLLQKYQGHVFKIIKKHIPHEQSEEVAHDVFVRAYKSLSGFKNTSSFQHWLSSIAVRTCYDFWRKTYRNREIPISVLSEKQQHWIEAVTAEQAHRSFSEQEARQEAQEVLTWALNKLSAEDRMIVELIYLEGLSGKDAAELLGWSVTNVKVRSFRARKKLEKLLRKNGIPSFS